MLLLSIIEVVLLLLYVGYLVRQYAQREVPLYIKLLTFISWIMSFGVVLIIPHDIYYTALKSRGEDSTGFDALLLVWRVVYWLNFVMTWVVLPLFQEYEDAGEFTMKSKMWVAIKNNLIIYGVFGVFGVVFVLYLMSVNKLEISAVLGLLVTLANCFGVLLIVVLLGYGLVEIPKDYWRNSQYETCLKFNRFEAVSIKEAMISVSYDLEDITNLLVALRKQYETEPNWTNYVDQILYKVPLEFVESSETKINADINGRVRREIGDISLSKLSELHRKVKRISAEYTRAQTKWEDLCKKTFLIEDLLENRHSVEKRVRSTLWQQHRGTLGKCIDTLSWCWYTKIQRIYLVSLFFIFTALSCIVLLGEISIFTHVDLNLLSHLLKGNYGLVSIQVSIMYLFFVLMPLMYVSFGAYYGLFHIRLAGLYGFYDHQHTDAPSLMFGSINFSRVSFPLAYNFLQMMSIEEKTPFKSIIGDMDVIPQIGASMTLGMIVQYFIYPFFFFFFFCEVLPILLIVVSVFNFFDIYDKILSALGLPQFQFHEEFDDLRIEEGKKLLYRARVQSERQILNQNNKRMRNSDVEMSYGSMVTNTRSSSSKVQYSTFQNLEEILKI